jgi:hypothetical protein
MWVHRGSQTPPQPLKQQSRSKREILIVLYDRDGRKELIQIADFDRSCRFFGFCLRLWGINLVIAEPRSSFTFPELWVRVAIDRSDLLIFSQD